jgi:hypothetical protein
MRTFMLKVGWMKDHADQAALIGSTDPDSFSIYEVSFECCSIHGMTIEEAAETLLWGKAAMDNWTREDSFSFFEEEVEEIVKVLVLSDGGTYDPDIDKCWILQLDPGLYEHEVEQWVKDNVKEKGMSFTYEECISGKIHKKCSDVFLAVVVFSDGETYDSIIGSKIIDIPARIDPDDVEEWLKRHEDEGLHLWKGVSEWIPE